MYNIYLLGPFPNCISLQKVKKFTQFLECRTDATSFSWGIFLLSVKFYPTRRVIFIALNIICKICKI